MVPIKGITVILHNKIQNGEDPFGNPIWEENSISVDNVLVSPTDSSDVLTEMQISGKRSAYTLCIPKGDTNKWENSEVEFFGERFRTIGIPKQYIEELLPLYWNKQIEVERYE